MHMEKFDGCREAARTTETSRGNEICPAPIGSLPRLASVVALAGSAGQPVESRLAVALWLCGVLFFASVFVQPGEAHKPITSKYTYNDDVFPILKERCSRCHVQGGVAPMSLMTYEEAFPWGESIRAELVAAHMPPAAADEGFGDIKRGHVVSLTPKEVDVLLTWASGGNPRGALEQKLPPVTLRNEWSLGTPDLALSLPAEVTIAADAMEETREITIATGTKEPRWVRAVDLLPGNPAIVRSAVIVLKDAPDRVLARWVPGQDLVPLDGNAAFRLPAGAALVARIRYKKTWSYEGKTMTDRSTVGIYFARNSDAREITALALAAQALPAEKGQRFSFSRTIEQDVQAYAIDPAQVPDDVSLQMEAVTPDGRRTPLLRFVTRADWTRRYWLNAPLPLPRGTRIEVSGVMEDAELTSAAFGGPSGTQKSGTPTTLKLALDVVSAAAKSAAP
jgi:hypothetical protein